MESLRCMEYYVFGFQVLFLGLIFKENNQNLLLYEGEK